MIAVKHLAKVNRTHISRLFTLFCLVVLLVGHISSVVSALSPEQKKLYTSGVYYYDLCGGDGGESGSIQTGTGMADADIPGKDNEEKIWNNLS